jgi:hypothetical protein
MSDAFARGGFLYTRRAQAQTTSPRQWPRSALRRSQDLRAQRFTLPVSDQRNPGLGRVTHRVHITHLIESGGSTAGTVRRACPWPTRPRLSAAAGTPPPSHDQFCRVATPAPPRHACPLSAAVGVGGTASVHVRQGALRALTKSSPSPVAALPQIASAHCGPRRHPTLRLASTAALIARTGFAR